MAKDLNIGSSTSAVNMSLPNGGIKDKNSSLGTSGQVLKSDGEKVYWANESGGGGGSSTGPLAACSATGTAGATSLGAGTITTVPLTTFVSNTDSSAFEISSNGIKCNADGTIMVSGSVYGGYSGTANSGVYIKKNTSEIGSEYNISNSICGKGCSPIIINVTAGDVLYLCFRCSVAGTFYPNNTATHIDIMYLTAAAATDDHINSLIDAKLEVIENGTY